MPRGRPKTKTTTEDSARNNAPTRKAARPDVRFIPLELVEASPYNPREGDDAEISELAASLKLYGLQQPVVVRPIEGQRFQLVAGHRRAAAGRSLGWEAIVASVIEADDEQAATRTLEENIKRRDLGGLEKARFLNRYITEFGVTQADAGERFGMAQETVSNLLALLDAPAEVRQLVDEGKLTPSHVKPLLSLSEKKQVELAKNAAAYGTSSRDMEQQVKWAKEDERRKAQEKSNKEKVRTKELPKLAKRLTEGLTGDGSKEHPFEDPKHPGLPVLFGSVKIDYNEYQAQEPWFRNKQYDADSDAQLQPALKQMGVRIGYGYGRDGDPNIVSLSRYDDTATKTYTLSAETRRKVGAKGKGACPCGSTHVVVRGWGVTSDRFDYYGRNIDLTKPVETHIFCADPCAVTLALAHRKVKEAEAERELASKEAEALVRFTEDVAPKGGPEVAAFLWATVAGRPVEIALAKGQPEQVWPELVRIAARQYEERTGYGPRSLRVLDLIKSAVETPAQAGDLKPKAEADDDDGGVDLVCDHCDNEFVADPGDDEDGAPYACGQCEEAVFCSEVCQMSHLNEYHGDDDADAEAEAEDFSDPKEDDALAGTTMQGVEIDAGSDQP